MKMIDIERAILESFSTISNVSMSRSHILQYVKRQYPEITPGQVKKSLENLEEKNLLAPTTYALHSRIYPVKEFIGHCTLCHFMDRDGSAYILTENLEQGDRIFPSNIHAGKIPQCNFIIWYSK